MDLLRSNYNVPKGFVMPRELIKTKGSIKKYAREIEKYFKNEIESFPVVVRSSSSHEDSSSLTYAGQFKSVIGVKSSQEMFDAILEVSNSGKIDLSHYDIRHSMDRPAVIVQKQIKPHYSGVLFTKHPIRGGFLLEYVSGHLSKMVSGKEPSHKVFNKGKLKGKFLEVYKIGKQIEQYYGTPQDIEFIIDEKNKVWIVQSRPITTLKGGSYTKKNKSFKGFARIKGITLSRGFFKGKIQFIYDDLTPEEAEKVFQKGNILATYVLFPEFNKVYYRAGGVICMVDSITSHPAIIARELRIPCVGGIDITKLSKQLWDFDQCIIDAEKGEIRIKPRIKILEKINKGITHMNFPASCEYLLLEKGILTAIKNLDDRLLEAEINKAVAYMEENFISFLKNKKKENLNQAKSVFYNLAHLLQHKFILALKDSGYSHNELVKSFADVDSGAIDSELDKVYSIIKKSIQTLDEKATYKGKALWEY
ncbi:MAG: PEP/pyruvate-binding domain-containing protein [archaeon]